MARRVLMAQPGPQTTFMASPADIVIYGGAAGGGKTYGLLLSPLRYKNVYGYNCTIFRRNYKQIFSPGGLWDESNEMYRNVRGAVPKISAGTWLFRDGRGATVSKVVFAHIGSDSELWGYQGSQICGLCFDELTHFTEKQFFYMLSRNRSTCGVSPYVRATCNPDADSWVASFIEWWIDQETGYPIRERSGRLRWFVRRDEEIHWADTREELWERFGLETEQERAEPKSATFISSSVLDNRELLRSDPGYLNNLKTLPLLDRERLLMGNWKIKAAAGMFFKRSQLGGILEVIPDDVVQWVRCWDLAATDKDENGDASYTAGVLMGKRKNGRYVVADVVNRQMAAAEVRQTIRLTAQGDRARFKRVRIRLPQDPGQAGKEQAQSYVKLLSGFDVTTVSETGSKESRAEPMAAQWQAGNFDIVAAPWNDPYLNQLENFPEGRFKDMVDASANGFTEIELRSRFNVENLI